MLHEYFEKSNSVSGKHPLISNRSPFIMASSPRRGAACVPMRAWMSQYNFFILKKKTSCHLYTQR